MDQSGYFPPPRRQLSGPAAPGSHSSEHQNQRQYEPQPHDTGSGSGSGSGSGHQYYQQQQPPLSSEHRPLERAPLSSPAGSGPSSQSHHRHQRQDSLHLDSGAHSHQHYDTSELHMPGLSPIDHHGSSPQNPPFAPHRPPTLTLNQPLSNSGAVGAAYTQQHGSHPQQLSPLHPPQRPESDQFVDSVPNVLQPAGGTSNRPQPVPSITAPTIPTIKHPEPPQPSQHQQSRAASGSSFLQSHDTSLNNTLDTNMAHAYSRSSPAAGYDASSSAYHSYTPTTPGGGSAGANHFMSPTDLKYTAPGSQRNISNTPLGLADIRPRADSSMSDSGAAALGYDHGHTQSDTSNYLAPWAIYAFDWCKWAPQGNGAGKLAVGSYLEDGHNFIQILDSHLMPTPQDVYQPGTSKYSLEFNKVAEATHSYPVTRLLWEPPSSQKQSTDLLATSGDHLRLWSLPSETPATPGSSINNRGRDQPTTKLTPLALLSNSKTPDHTAPLTSLDWNTVSPSLIITSSIDTTCTIWDIPSLTAKTQLIAHDKEVYDVRFCANSVDVFVSCGQDGSVRMFDLRSLEHSTIIYEPTGKDDKDPAGRTSPTTAQQTMSNPPPLLRLATSPHDTHLLATFAQDSGVIRILDVRQPGQALLELRGHSGAINCLEWSPLRRGTLASGGDDCQVLLWDLLNANAAPGAPINGGSQQDGGRSPVASWECEYEIGNLGWVPHLQGAGDAGEWLGVSAGRGIWGTRVM